MERSAVLLQRVAMGGTRAHMARMARLGVKWPRGRGRYMDKLRAATARMALDRMGAACASDIVRCGLLEEQEGKLMQWDGFDPLCALLMQPVSPERILLTLESTDPGRGRQFQWRMGEVGVRVVQAACRLLPCYGQARQEGTKAWLGVVDKLIAMGMSKQARLPYAPVGMLAACTDAGIARGLLDRGFPPEGPQGSLPALCLCHDAAVARVLIAAGASCQVPSMDFIDNPLSRSGYVQREDERVFARWCRLDKAMAQEILASSEIALACDHEIKEAIAAIDDHGAGNEPAVRGLFRLLCEKVGMDRIEEVMGGEDSLVRRGMMINSGMFQGYLEARAKTSCARLAAGTPGHETQISCVMVRL